jgi:AcrR family transcriptional regulator
MTAQTGDRRAQIVAATYRAIAREGVAAITTRKIAGEAGVNLATLHSLFGSKDALLVAVLDQVTGLTIGALAPPAQAHHGLRAAVAETATALWALADREPRLLLVRCELLLYLERRPTHAEEARAQQRRYLAALADLYRRGRASTDGSITCQTLAQLVASHVDGLALHGAFLEPAKTPRHIRAQALRAVLALVEGDLPPTGTTNGSGQRTHREPVRRQRPAARGTPPGVGTAR